MKIIITGVAGFIGSNLARFLLNIDYKVVGIDNFYCGFEDNISDLYSYQNFQFIQSDAHDQKVQNHIHEGDIVIHLGAISSLAKNQEIPTDCYYYNVLSTSGLLEICRQKGIKHFIFASTSAIYENTKVFPTKEDDDSKPTLLYSLSKYQCEEVIRSFYDVYGLPYSIIRLYNVFGPHQDILRQNPPLVPYIISSFQKGESPFLHSTGEQRRDYVYIKDVLSLIKILIDGESVNTSLNVCSGNTISVKEIVNVIKDEMNVNIEPVYRDASLLWNKDQRMWRGKYPFTESRMVDEVEKYTLGSDQKTFDLLGWKCKYTFAEGIKDMLQKK